MKKPEAHHKSEETRSSTDCLKLECEEYLRNQRGLSERTRYHCWRLADRFPQSRFNGDSGDLSIVTGDDIARFMQHPGDRSARLGRSPLTFFVLTFALAVPFVVFGALTGLLLLPGLPVAALMFVCPGMAALILTYREHGTAGAKALLNRALDYKRISPKVWYSPILLIAPCVAVLSYGVIRLTGTPVPALQIAVLPTLLLCVTFFVAALGEELGWSGYVIDPLQNRWGALKASLFLGSIWAVFHYAALLEAHRSIVWIAWWSLGTVATRVIMVWLYNHAGKSVVGAALFHMTVNLAWQLFPIRGSYFDPRINGLIMAMVAAIFIVVWGPRTSSSLRESK